ncbi:glycosyltransferase [Oceanihabitans sediminis]|uniref:CgeB family protein n=1 Tax=Oceanihabitans sediminis TaxID=1812012 RepID=UPI00299E24F4|nr:glycosyltransferase [Oceanihabitans sediminis]MDX1279322.1 glycosyltransferase [Oceanihabitans sediminis]
MILGNFQDMQTGHYIMNACKEFSSDVLGIDIRGILRDFDNATGQGVILDEINDSRMTPDIILVMKGLELTNQTLIKIKEMFPKAKLVNWFFDIFLGDKPIWQQEGYFETLKMFDYYFCSLKGVADELNELGFDNAMFLDEAYDPVYNGEVLSNYYQGLKYGGDISFVGTLGYLKQHGNRIPLLSHLVDEGFNIKIWGEIICDWKHIPANIRPYCLNTSVINEKHSMVAQNSVINLGIDQNQTIDCGWSARLFRVLAAGGCYVTNDTKGLSKYFKVNGKEITGEEDLIIFRNPAHLIEILDFLLEHQDIAKKIGENGKKAVENHTFKDRIKEMLEVIK